LLSESDTKQNNVVGKSNSQKSESHATRQNTFEFDLSEEKKKEERDFEALYPTTLKKRGNPEEKKIITKSSEMTEDEVEEMENIPAYQRRQIRMNDPKYKNKVSKFSITKDNKISDRNSYLYDQVD